MRSPALLALSVPVLFAAVACGGATTGNVTGSDPSGQQGTPPSGTTTTTTPPVDTSTNPPVDPPVTGVDCERADDSLPPGLAPINDCTRVIVAENHGGGFAPEPPPGSNCVIGAAKYTFDRDTLLLAWTRCATKGANDPYIEETGSRTITAGEAKSLEPTFGAVAVTHDNTMCGADKPLVTLTVSYGHSQVEYYDDFYACNGGGNTYVSNLDDVLGAFDDLAK